MAVPSQNLQAYGHDLVYWTSISTIPSCRKVIELWGTKDQMPKPKASKAQVVEAALRVVTSRNPQPGAIHFFSIISNGKEVPDWLEAQQPSNTGKLNLPGTAGEQQTPSDNNVEKAGPSRTEKHGPTAKPGKPIKSGLGRNPFPPTQHLTPSIGPVGRPVIPSGSSLPLVELSRRRPLVTNDDASARQASWREVFEDTQTRALHRGTEVAGDARRTTSNLRPAKHLSSVNTTTLEGLFNDEDDPRISHVRVRFFEDDSRILGYDNRNYEALQRPRSHFPVQEYMFSGLGKLYPYRGRGPVWDNNSCALDCVLVVARLLDVGLTAADIGDQPRELWLASLDDFEMAFIDAVHADWDIYTKATSISQRRLFMNQFINRSNSKKPPTAPKSRLGDFLASTALWEECTSMANQFTFRTRRISICASCGQSNSSKQVEPEQRSITLRDPTPTQDTDISMADLLQQWFGVPDRAEHRDHGPPNGCGAPGLFSRRVVVGEMPHRLVVLPSMQYRNIRGATDDTIRFQYLGTDGREHAAVYRWLGGIYYQLHHFRVYWRDSPYPDRSGNIKLYDGKLLLGTIIGGVPPQHPDYKVVDWWANGTDILFYERVDVNDAAAASRITQEVSQKIATRFNKQVKGRSQSQLVTPSKKPSDTAPQEGKDKSDDKGVPGMTLRSNTSSNRAGGSRGVVKDKPVIPQPSKNTKGKGEAIGETPADEDENSSNLKTIKAPTKRSKGRPKKAPSKATHPPSTSLGPAPSLGSESKKPPSKANTPNLLPSLSDPAPDPGSESKKPSSKAGTKRLHTTSPDRAPNLGSEAKKPSSKAGTKRPHTTSPDPASNRDLKPKKPRLSGP